MKKHSMGNKEITIVCYAEKAVIISEDQENLQSFMYKFKKIAQAFEMQISSETITFTVGTREQRRYIFRVQNKYLGIGVNITSNRNLKNDVKAQTTKT